jgi:hypothetical protein
VARAFLTYSTAVILQAVANGYRYGFDVIDIDRLPGGTVYPALAPARRTPATSRRRGRKKGIARAEPRPPAQVLRADALGPRRRSAEAVKRYRLLEQTQPSRARTPKAVAGVKA